MGKKPRRELPVIAFPAMRCDKYCGECCGIVPVSMAEVARVKAYVKEHGVVPVSQGVRCPYYQRGTCAIYEVRPKVCVAYGHSWKMQCPRGYNANVEDEVALGKWVTSDGMPVATLHDVAQVPLGVSERDVLQMLFPGRP